MSETMISERKLLKMARQVGCLNNKRSKPNTQQRLLFKNILKKLDDELYKLEMLFLNLVIRLTLFLLFKFPVHVILSPWYLIKALIWSYQNRPTRKEFLLEFVMLTWQFAFVGLFLSGCLLVSNFENVSSLVRVPRFETRDEVKVSRASTVFQISERELKKLRSPGGEIYELARAMYGETVGDGVIGQLSTAGSVFERVDRPDFPNTILGVLHQPYSNGWGCQYNSLCDDLHEDMDSEMGQRILDLATNAWMDYHAGTFISPAGDSHSFCTPRACRKHWGYFGKLKLLARIGGHEWYG